MIQVKIYEYNSANESNGYRGTDYSQYVLEAGTFRDILDDTLETHELTLAGLPFRNEFAPSTKFVIDLIQNDVTWKTLNIEVDNDSVSQPIISKDDYFNHALTLIECGVDAQQRTVDNIALTYKLQDVTLDVQPSYSTDETVYVAKNQIQNGNFNVNFGRTYTINGLWSYESIFTAHNFSWEMSSWHSGTWQDWENVKQNVVIPYDGENPNQSTIQISLPVPNLKCFGGHQNSQNSYFLNGYCSVQVVLERKPVGSNIFSEVSRTNFLPSTYYSQENAWDNDWTVTEAFYGTPPQKGYIISGYRAYKAHENPIADKYFYGVATQICTGYDSTATTRIFTFTAEQNYTYRIKVIPLFGQLNKPEWWATNMPAYVSQGAIETNNYIISASQNVTNNSSFVNNDTLSVGVEFNVFKEDQYGETIFASAPPANAYDLFNKAVLSTENFRKISGVPCDETTTPYYFNLDDKQELQNTRVVENFYHQKNLWEIVMEVGKYIHARPVVKFGSDDRFRVGWKRYGVTDQNQDTATHLSVYNSRFVGEYVSALSSYVDNMVQLGGTITEVVSPKSSSEDFLVYNDVAEINVTKPITEIVGFSATNSAGTTVDLLSLPSPSGHSGIIYGAVYEYSVYKLLSVNKNTYPNKGYALYYNLGENIIKGLTYRLPTPSTGDVDNDYAIKNILAQAFGISTTDRPNIKVNDYTFTIQYRTKDSLRSDQTRPDLRKYLLASKYDNVPQHYQFNNQQDILVDSVKFGINTFGKLIRTGNTTYSIVEWNTELGALKNAGELYNIYDNLYYVSRATHTIFPDHIESEIEYSKDFNRLAQIIGIPSEPRFYEIADQSQIRREKSFNSYLLLGDQATISADEPIKSYINGQKGFGYVNSLLFRSAVSFPKYAYTAFKNDIDKPSSSGINHLAKVFTPISAYSTQNTMTLEWDMLNNVSAGDQVGSEVTINGKTADEAYRTLLPYKYTDVYCRSDLVDFAILNDYTMTQEQIRALPASPIENVNADFDKLVFRTPSIDINSHSEGEVLLKDNREAISINANTQMLTASDRFVLSSYLWQPNKGTLKVGLLKTEVNKLSPSTIGLNDFVDGADELTLTTNVASNYRDIDISTNAAIATNDTLLIGFRDISDVSTTLPTGITIVGGKIKIATAGNYNIGAFILSIVRAVGHLTSKLSLSLVLEDEVGTTVSTIGSVSSTSAITVSFPKYSITTTSDNMYVALYATCTYGGILDNGFDGLLSFTSTQFSLGFPQTVINIDINSLFAGLSAEQIAATNAVVIYSTSVEVGNTATSGAHYFVVAKNVGGLTANQKFTSWAISTPSKSLFLHQ